MSVLLAGLDHPLALLTARRLIDQGDEVRVLVTEDRFAPTYTDLGVHVALGREKDDPDLIERASQNVRTLVLGTLSAEELKHVLMGATPANVTRIVYVTDNPGGEVEVLKAGAIGYVILRCPRPGFLGRGGVDPDALAAAIDAGDDLAGDPRLDLDLARTAAWTELKLPVPGGTRD